ncbi:CheR family methyltransferase [Desulfonema magnum]|uniref:protein-glutamate O-methyltransferase n=1 Tax=Desulfonema magnum TaxID=45655 RepID=A0A975BS80_9BACT|nr:protein-glutamate O-methyltransferase CheR [Desulfonema magnum]QTA90482.1 Chemotaxis protein methyltransferase [Desulfonema magnum]
MKLSENEFELLRNYIYNICGLFIPDNKAYLIRQRLEPIAEAAKCRSFGEFYRKIKYSPLPIYQEQIINAITTNETSFFRDTHPFLTFREYILPRLSEMIRERKLRGNSRKGSKVGLWSAGSSTGQEPYSLAMVIHEYVEENRSFQKEKAFPVSVSEEDFGILATDISSEVLSRAIVGEYGEMELRRGLSSERVEKYFGKVGGRWLINSSIRSMVEFRQMNLMNTFTVLGGFDVIFCRNVLIYFDIDTKSRIIDQFHTMLSENGLLILGTTENVYALTDKFDSLHYGETLLYKKKAVI